MELVNSNNASRFLDDINTHSCVVYPVFSSSDEHPLEDRLSFVYFFVKHLRNEYILNYNHIDFPKSSLDIGVFTSKCNDIVYKKRYLPGSGIDADLLYWWTKDIPLPILEVKNPTQFVRNNDITPIYQYVTKIRKIVEMLEQLPEAPPGVTKYNQFINELGEIERNAITIYPGTIYDKPQIGKLVHTVYNPYTLTGRPTNTWKGVNYAALNKTNGIRKTLISRHPGGFLVEFDYHAYHLQLISKLLNYTFPVGNVYDYLKTQMHLNTNDDVKSIVFHQLYGGVQTKYQSIPFFAKLSEYLHTMQNAYDDDVIYSKFGKKIRKGETLIKTFNYFLQNLETEENMLKLCKINALLRNTRSKVILYTYDSFLIDFNPADSVQVLYDIKKILEEDGIGTKMKIGKNYHDMYVH